MTVTLTRTLSLVVVVSLFVAAEAVGQRPAAPQYTFTSIDPPDTQGGTYALGINSRGDIVGSFDWHGYVYRDGTYTTIDVPNAQSTRASGINQGGTIVGSFIENTAPGSHGFVYADGVFRTIDVPGAGTANGPATRAHGINEAGDIVGDFDVQVGAGAETHGYLYRDGVFTIIDFPGAYITQAFGINDRGDIVGLMAFPGGSYTGFIYSGGTFTQLNNPASSGPPGEAGNTAAFGINNRRQIVGGFTLEGAGRAFVFHDGLFTTLDLPSSSAWGINEAGGIVGVNSNNGDPGFLAEPLHGQRSTQ